MKTTTRSFICMTINLIVLQKHKNKLLLINARQSQETKNCRETTSALEPRKQHDSEIKQTEQAKE